MEEESQPEDKGSSLPRRNALNASTHSQSYAMNPSSLFLLSPFFFSSSLHFSLSSPLSSHTWALLLPSLHTRPIFLPFWARTDAHRGLADSRHAATGKPGDVLHCDATWCTVVRQSSRDTSPSSRTLHVI